MKLVLAARTSIIRMHMLRMLIVTLNNSPAHRRFNKQSFALLVAAIEKRKQVAEHACLHLGIY